jgi:hypothetical protein
MIDPDYTKRPTALDCNLLLSATKTEAFAFAFHEAATMMKESLQGPEEKAGVAVLGQEVLRRLRGGSPGTDIPLFTQMIKGSCRGVTVSMSNFLEAMTNSAAERQGPTLAEVRDFFKAAQRILAVDWDP